MRTNKIFDPFKVRPEDYRSRYPELKRIPEFELLTATELKFVWYYANPTSDIIDVENDMERVAQALVLSNYTPAKGIKDDISVLRFPEKFAIAIERMSRFEPGIRFKARKMIELILDSYESLCDKNQYKDKETKEVDVSKYVTATTKIAQELPSLIAKMEEGFGATTRSLDEDEQAIAFTRDWYINRGNKNKSHVTSNSDQAKQT